MIQTDSSICVFHRTRLLTRSCPNRKTNCPVELQNYWNTTPQRSYAYLSNTPSHQVSTTLRSTTMADHEQPAPPRILNYLSVSHPGCERYRRLMWSIRLYSMPSSMPSQTIDLSKLQPIVCVRSSRILERWMSRLRSSNLSILESLP